MAVIVQNHWRPSGACADMNMRPTQRSPSHTSKSFGPQSMAPNRFLFACLILLLSPSLSLYAQEERGWTFSGRFQGSTSSAGTVLKLDPSLGYAFNPHVETYIGLPAYLVNQPTTTTTTGGFVNGIGNGLCQAPLWVVPELQGLLGER